MDASSTWACFATAVRSGDRLRRRRHPARGGARHHAGVSSAEPLPRPADDRAHARRRGAGEFRGSPAIHFEELEKLLVRVSEMVCELPWIAEMDVNPVIADERGVVAVDARVVVDAAAARSPSATRTSRSFPTRRTSRRCAPRPTGSSTRSGRFAPRMPTGCRTSCATCPGVALLPLHLGALGADAEDAGALHAGRLRPGSWRWSRWPAPARRKRSASSAWFDTC